MRHTFHPTYLKDNLLVSACLSVGSAYTISRQEYEVPETSICVLNVNLINKLARHVFGNDSEIDRKTTDHPSLCHL